MRARDAAALVALGYLAGRVVGEVRWWLDALADLPEFPSDDDPVLDLPWTDVLQAEDATEFVVPGGHIELREPGGCSWCVPDFYGEPVDVSPTFAGPCVHVKFHRAFRAARAAIDPSRST